MLRAMQSPTEQERQAALFNSTAVHASFGDIELAQITLRGPLLVTACCMIATMIKSPLLEPSNLQILYHMASICGPKGKCLEVLLQM